MSKPQKRGKTFFLVLAIICAVMVVVLSAVLIWYISDPTVKTEEFASKIHVPEHISPNETYVCPVDFKALKKQNPDIYAWIYIPGTNVSFPVVNRKGNDDFYLDHNSDGKRARKGAIFSEHYNSTDLSDPVTVFYGHKMKNGDMFGNLQKYYSDHEFFDANREIYVFTPDSLKKYRIFAALPYTNAHLLYYYDFSDPFVFDSVFTDILSVKKINAIIDKNTTFTSDDRIIILSTCLSGNNKNRYLVLAVEEY